MSLWDVLAHAGAEWAIGAAWVGLVLGVILAVALICREGARPRRPSIAELLDTDDHAALRTGHDPEVRDDH